MAKSAKGEVLARAAAPFMNHQRSRVPVTLREIGPLGRGAHGYS